ncbi:hypothetical protein KC992_00530 [Candidatus Saccharibacteria bacterium]|nr:hypothetical protein [Candidatus Saccharibacteria bacterium]MCA9328762.1 hypothetical protein [Candidatus Saccharibacteria bacterium]
MAKKQTFIQHEEEQVKKFHKTYSQKYPMVFALGATFGLVSVLYGFEKLIDKVDLFSNNPWILLATGLAVLSVTGSFYNKLR